MSTPRADDAGSLPVAMLVTIVGLMLSTLLVNTVLQQATTTKTEVARVAALSAAQTGIDVGLAHIRAANNGSGSGVLARLPCGSLTGTLATVTGAARSSYAVAIAYYPTDPQNHLPSWLFANLIPCLSGGGTLNTPGYALLTAKGTYSSSSGGTLTSRTITATYPFQTTNLNIAGGLIHVYKTSTSTDLCIDASSSSPVAGTAAQMRACTAGSVQQTWAYNPNLTLSLVSSKTASMPLGMCLDAGSSHALGKVLYLQPCATPTTLPQQQWSFNGATNFEGTANGSTTDGYCFNVQNPNVAGSFLVLGSASASTCYDNNFDTRQSFSPEATAGAGAAGTASGQLINFRQFGRCIDVTTGKITAYLIVWPCKQSPNPANVGWNQKWVTPALVDGPTGTTGLITTTHPTLGLLCMHSPLSTVAGQYVTVVQCTTTDTGPNLIWTVRNNTGTYATGYTIADSSGKCLSPTDPTAVPPDLHPGGVKISKLIVAACDGSTLQKWNAPPSILQALPLKDIREN